MSGYTRERRSESHQRGDEEEPEKIRLFLPDPDLEENNSMKILNELHQSPQEIVFQMDFHNANDISNVKGIRIDRPAMNLGVMTFSPDKPEATVGETTRKYLSKKCSKCSPLNCLYSLMPIFYWLPRYNLKKHLSYDLIAGFTIAVLQIPQGMAYALLGNLPPIIGLYMAFFPVIIYAIMGTSKHVSIGTFAVICLMSGKVAYERLQELHGDLSTVTDDDDNVMNYTSFSETLVETNDDVTMYNIVEVSAALSLIVGIWQIIFGILHTGAISLLLSTELVSGFTTGAAFHVLTSQVRTVLGLKMARRTGLFKIIMTYVDVFTNIHTCNVAAVIMSLTTFVILFLYNEVLRPIISKKIKFPIPVELFCIIIGTVASRIWDFHDTFAVSIVHTIPTGLPIPTLVPLEILPNLISDGLLIAIVAFAISISMIKIFSTKHGYEIDPNQELLAQGTSNVVGSFFSCAPISVSLSRSAIQDSIGGKTQLVGLFSSLLILIVLLWIGPFFETLPNCVLSAIIIVALKGMFLQIYDLPKAWKMSKLNGGIWILTAVSTIVLDVEYGLGIGLILSTLTLIWRSNVPSINVLGSFSNNMDIYMDVSETNAKELPKIKIIKYTGSLNFVTVEYFLVKLYKIVPIQKIKSTKRSEVFNLDDKMRNPINNNEFNQETNNIQSTTFNNRNNSVGGCRNKQTEQIEFIIFDFASVSSIDPAALKSIKQLYNSYQTINVQVLFAALPPSVLNTFCSCGILKEIGLSNFFPSINDAVCVAKSSTS